MIVFFGTDGTAESNFSFLNESTNGYLAVTGVIYGLFTTNLMQSANIKFSGISNNFHEEITGCLEIVLIVKALVTPFNEDHNDRIHSERVLEVQKESIRVVMTYLKYSINNWGFRTFRNDKHHLESLYSILPGISEIIELTELSFNDKLSGKVMDALGLISHARATRHAYEEDRIHIVSWITNIVLATAMFFGVLLLYSASEGIALTMCYLVTIVIGMSTFIIVEISCPYSGFISVNSDPMVELLESLEDKNSSMQLRRGAVSHKEGSSKANDVARLLNKGKKKVHLGKVMGLGLGSPIGSRLGSKLGLFGYDTGLLNAVAPTDSDDAEPSTPP